MYVCPSNVNFINTMIIMKKIIYLVLLALITGLAAQAHEKTGEWNGCDRYDFTFKDRQATIVVPKKAAKGNPWIWRPAFFDAFPSVDKALLEKGFHIVYYDVTHLYGSPRAVSLGTEFYENMTDLYNLSEKSHAGRIQPRRFVRLQLGGSKYRESGLYICRRSCLRRV